MLDDSTRQRILSFVRPLDAGLDGVANFGQVEARLARLTRLGAERKGLDEELLFLLGVFYGRAKWLGRMGHQSRTQIFLEGLGLPVERLRIFFRSLARAESEPVSEEEKLVSDADALEKLGAIGLLQGIVDAYRERLELAETADELVAEQERIRFHTPEGKALARERIVFARSFAAELRCELEQQG